MKDDPFGIEFAEIELAPQRLDAEGVAIGVGPIPYGTFAADITLDGDGIVVDYPGIARRL